MNLSLDQIKKDYPNIFKRIKKDFFECDDKELKEICNKCIDIDKNKDLFSI